MKMYVHFRQGCVPCSCVCPQFAFVFCNASNVLDVPCSCLLLSEDSVNSCRQSVLFGCAILPCHFDNVYLAHCIAACKIPLLVSVSWWLCSHLLSLFPGWVSPAASQHHMCTCTYNKVLFISTSWWWDLPQEVARSMLPIQYSSCIWHQALLRSCEHHKVNSEKWPLHPVLLQGDARLTVKYLIMPSFLFRSYPLSFIASFCNSWCFEVSLLIFFLFPVSSLFLPTCFSFSFFFLGGGHLLTKTPNLSVNSQSVLFSSVLYFLLLFAAHWIRW